MASAFEKAVSILLAHYQSDYDTTVPGKEFDAEVRRIVAAYTSQVRDAALEECRKELIANGEHQAVEVIRKLQEKP